MRNAAIIAIGLFLVGTYCLAGGRIENGMRVDGFAPSYQTIYQSTKADIVIPTTGITKIGLTPSANVTRKIGAEGAGVPHASGVEVVRVVTTSAPNYVFSVTSSATATKIYVETE